MKLLVQNADGSREMENVQHIRFTPFALLQQPLIDSDEHTAGFKLMHIPTGSAVALFGWYTADAAITAVNNWWQSIDPYAQEIFATSDIRLIATLGPSRNRLVSLRVASNFTWEVKSKQAKP
jgi:hypothetical protein